MPGTPPRLALHDLHDDALREIAQYLSLHDVNALGACCWALRNHVAKLRKLCIEEPLPVNTFPFSEAVGDGHSEVLAKTSRGNYQWLPHQTPRPGDPVVCGINPPVFINTINAHRSTAVAISNRRAAKEIMPGAPWVFDKHVTRLLAIEGLDRCTLVVDDKVRLPMRADPGTTTIKIDILMFPSAVYRFEFKQQQSKPAFIRIAEELDVNGDAQWFYKVCTRMQCVRTVYEAPQQIKYSRPAEIARVLIQADWLDPEAMLVADDGSRMRIALKYLNRLDDHTLEWVFGEGHASGHHVLAISKLQIINTDVAHTIIAFERKSIAYIAPSLPRLECRSGH